MSKIKCITYGCGSFDYDKFIHLKNRTDYFNKPSGGLWSSPIDSDHNWYDWCIGNEFGDLSTAFSFIYDGNTYIIDNEDDFYGMDILTYSKLNITYPDFEKLFKDGYDAIHLTANGEQVTRFNMPMTMHGWDCETLFVMNHECISNAQDVKKVGINHNENK